MNEICYLLLLIPIVGLCIWVVQKQSFHENHYWVSALGMPLVPPDGMQPDLERHREALLKICLASGYTTASEFLVGAEKAFLRLTKSALKGDLEDDAGLASESARSRIRDCAGIYSSEMASFAEIVDARKLGHFAFVSVQFGRPSLHQSVWKEPKDWGEARQRVRTATQIWVFERDLRSPDPNWFLTDVHDQTETRISAPSRC